MIEELIIIFNFDMGNTFTVIKYFRIERVQHLEISVKINMCESL